MSFENGEDAGVLAGIRLGHIQKLEVHFHGATTLIPTKLQPELCGRHPIMPDK